MKRILLLLTILLTFIFANYIKWQSSYGVALDRAKGECKDLIVLLIKNDCRECKDIVRDVFTNKDYIDDLNSRFIFVVINFDSKVSYPIEMYWSREFPTLFFVDSKTETFLREPIYREITEQKIRNFLKKYKLNQ